MTSIHFHASMAALVAGLSISSAAFAQEAQADDRLNGEIIVTATRNETLASKTPVALTAVSGEALRSAGVTNPTALAEQVPNLSIDRNNNGLQITIRGVTSGDNTEKGDPSAAFMIDGVYIARPQAQEVSFFDLQRVEVLRGPQGTLFGRNTTAGLVNVITNKPKLGSFSGSLDATYGNFDTQQITGVLNIPVSDAVAIRAAANYDRRDSYLIRGPAFTTALDPFKKNLSGRLSALFDLGDGELLIRGDYSSIKGVPTNVVLTSNFFANFNTPGVEPIYVGNSRSSEELRTLNVPYSNPVQRDNSTWGILTDFSYDIGPVTVNYLGSYRELKRREDDTFVIGGFGVVFPVAVHNDYWQNSQEIRLSTNGDGPLKAQAGLYYFKEKSAIEVNVIGFAPLGTPGYFLGFEQDPTIAESWAGFGQATYSVTENFRLTGGVRYSHDKKSRAGFTVNCGAVACDQPDDTRTPNFADRSFSKVTWRIGADFDLNDRTLLYGVVATGYKAGGFNDGCQIGTAPGCGLPAEALYYDPETLTSYEVGLKTRFLDNAVRLNASAFHYDYKNIQLSQVSTICGSVCNVTTNAAVAKVDGVELEGVIAPAASSRFDFSLAWLNARYSEFFPAPGVDWSDKKLDRSPSLTLTAGYTHTIELGNGGNIQAGVRTRVSDDYRLAALGTLNQFRVPGYTKTDMLLAYNAPNDGWYVQAFVKNLEDSIVVSSAASAPLTSPVGTTQISDPRTYGARVGVKF
ncbi:TonB-dependent receptor [Rhizorhapis suberifaciens]|uniref:Iron complex outermembrane receptor protein n=1 Tax=Rhizorhapis suberifaciens TaxID=13656 RepID=A0A840HYF1_9SPHN|nr:TonB-dependent receptor [Rhizorhapis suberifaciens]MBB4642538.1 iron complex outermembrane receptor protein [Rhizorhapis suberifaciens]